MILTTESVITIRGRPRSVLMDTTTGSIDIKLMMGGVPKLYKSFTGSIDGESLSGEGVTYVITPSGGASYELI